MLMLLSLPSTGTLEQLEACRAYFNNKEQYADATVLASTDTSEQLEVCRAYFNNKEQCIDAAVLVFLIPQNRLKLAEHTLIIRNNTLMLLSLSS